MKIHVQRGKYQAKDLRMQHVQQGVTGLKYHEIHTFHSGPQNGRRYKSCLLPYDLRSASYLVVHRWNVSSAWWVQRNGALEGHIMVRCVIIVNGACIGCGCIGNLVGAAKAY